MTHPVDPYVPLEIPGWQDILLRFRGVPSGTLFSSIAWIGFSAGSLVTRVFRQPPNPPANRSTAPSAASARFFVAFICGAIFPGSANPITYSTISKRYSSITGFVSTSLVIVSTCA